MSNMLSSIRTAFAAKRIFNFTTMRLFTARNMSSISRFPVPERNSLPEDIQEVMNEVEEKVYRLLSLYV